MPYEFLESLFGTPAEGEAPKAMTYAELEAAIDADEGLQLANLSAGGYVSQADYDTLNGQLTEANGKLEGYDPEWKTKMEQAGIDADAKVEGVVKDYAIRLAVDAAGTVDPDVVRLLIKPDDIKIDDGDVTGISEQLETLRKEKPYLFKDNGGKPYFGGPLGNQKQTGNADQDRVDARYANNPWFHK
ncbi:MAG: phage scaffolding protein [Clostridia bacterium]|nr:phage scaffolding protein [Clostridia bacterium]